MDVLPRCECVRGTEFTEVPDSRCTKCYGYGITPQGMEFMDAEEPCLYMAGSLEKIAWLTLRRQKGVHIWNKLDNLLQKKKKGGVLKNKYGTADEYKIRGLSTDDRRDTIAKSTNRRN